MQENVSPTYYGLFGALRWRLNAPVCLAGVNPFAKEATSPVKPSLAPSE